MSLARFWLQSDRAVPAQPLLKAVPGGRARRSPEQRWALMTARAFRLRAACCFCPSSCPARSFVLCYFESPQQKSMFPSGMLPQVRTCRWTVAAWHKLLGALTRCVYGQTFDLWCSILARSRGTVLLIFVLIAGAFVPTSACCDCSHNGH